MASVYSSVARAQSFSLKAVLACSFSASACCLLLVSAMMCTNDQGN